MIAIEIGPDVRNAPSMSFLFGWAIPIRSAKKNVKPIFLQNRTSMRERGVTPTLKASLNSIKLLSRYSNISRDRLLVYTYIPLYKMAFQIARTYTGKKFTKFPPNKFRADAGWYLEGKFVPSWEIVCGSNSRNA